MVDGDGTPAFEPGFFRVSGAVVPVIPLPYSEVVRRVKPLVERMLASADVGDEGDCWTWNRRIDRGGYGEIQIGGRQGRFRRAHRVAYELWVGPIPEGLVIDHLCRNRACVNPTHLEPVTNAENTRRGRTGQYLRNKGQGRTHCAHGHEWIAANLRTDRRGYDVCKICCADRYREWRERQRAQAA